MILWYPICSQSHRPTARQSTCLMDCPDPIWRASACYINVRNGCCVESWCGELAVRQCELCRRSSAVWSVVWRRLALRRVDWTSACSAQSVTGSPDWLSGYLFAAVPYRWRQTDCQWIGLALCRRWRSPESSSRLNGRPTPDHSRLGVFISG